MRKTKEEVKETRKRILDAAFELFASKKGFLHLTLYDIASAGGVTRGAIYWHFKDKRGLLMALWEDLNKSPPTPPGDTVWSQIESLEDLKLEMLRLLDHSSMSDRFALLWKFAIHRSEFPEEMEPILEKCRNDRREVLKHLTDVFTRMKELGRVRAGLDPVHAAMSTMAFVSGLIEIWLLDGTTFSITNDAPCLVDNLLWGMKR